MQFTKKQIYYQDKLITRHNYNLPTWHCEAMPFVTGWTTLIVCNKINLSEHYHSISAILLPWSVPMSKNFSFVV